MVRFAEVGILNYEFVGSREVLVRVSETGFHLYPIKKNDYEIFFSTIYFLRKIL